MQTLIMETRRNVNGPPAVLKVYCGQSPKQLYHPKFN